MSDQVAVIRKTDTAEVRVTRSEWRGRRIVDVRVWCIPRGGGEPVPTRKGITIDVSKCDDLIDALRQVIGGR